MPITTNVEYCSGQGVLDTTLCDKVCERLAAGLSVSLVSSTNNIDHHDITEILLKVALNTINLTHIYKIYIRCLCLYGLFVWGLVTGRIVILAEHFLHVLCQVK